MAVTSKYLMAEQVIDLLKGGGASAATSIEMPVIIKMIEQLCNAALKVEWFTAVSPTGETIPDGLVLATYENLSVVKYKQKFSRVQLPAIPISLPRGMGVYFVGPHVSDLYLASNTLTTSSVSNTSLTLNWTATPNATGYYIERATNAAFTQFLTPIYSGSLLTYNDTSLTATTNYWYRVKGVAANYNDSIFITTPVTTTSVPVIIGKILTELGSYILTETGDHILLES
jgi:hypothetical protein